MRLWFLPIFILASAQAATPARYDMTATIASVPVSGGESFGTKFFFATSDQAVYRIVPAGGNDGNPAASWKFWSTETGARDILPAAGYDTLEIKALNAAGATIGKSVTETPVHKEAALYWTATGGPSTPGGFDPGYSGLNAINSTTQTAGFSDSGTFKILAWDAANPGAGTTDIPTPAGYTSPQIVGVDDNGEVLVYVRSSGGIFRPAIWNGTTTEVIGPEPTETFYPSNCAINSTGDVAMLVFTAGGAAKLHYIPAANRAAWQTFTFSGPVDSSVYNLHISNAGVASFDTSINGLNTVATTSSVQAQQLTFTGYRSYLNSAGELVFGDQGNLLYWDAAVWTGQPAIVPVSAAGNSGGLDVVGFNDDGHVLFLNTVGSARVLGILTPAFAQPANVTVRPERKILRLRAGIRVRTRLIETIVSGDTLDSAIRYVVRGRLPAGMRFRKSDAILSGVPSKTGRNKLEVAATYRSSGITRQSPYTKVKIVIRSR